MAGTAEQLTGCKLRSCLTLPQRVVHDDYKTAAFLMRESPVLPAPRDHWTPDRSKLSDVGSIVNSGSQHINIKGRIASASRHRSWVFFSGLALFATLCAATNPYADGLSENFYNESCPYAAAIVDVYVTKFLHNNRAFAAAFNRLQFHDCWVGGCDGSILLNSTATNQAEREAHVNFGLRGVEEVDVIKAALEKVCPRVVSCADILILAARDATFKVGGKKWPVALGRRDSSVSTALEADTNLPFPVFPFPVLVDNFARKGFNAREMIVLSGAHTIGQSHCNGILPHLYNFTGGDNATDIDPTLDPAFAASLKAQCPQGNRLNVVPLDSTAASFDRVYYKDIFSGKGVFITDSALITDTVGKEIVTSLSKAPSTFKAEFAAAMVKMGNLGVLTGSQGEIRKKCQWVN